MNWEIYSYGSGDILRMIFTAIASIFGNSDYIVAMKTCALLGFVAVFFKAAFDQNVFNNFRWFIGMIVLVMLVLVPKVTVIVNDRITPSNSAVINNVPIGLAATAGFFSFSGDWLARSFETVFSMPNEVKYTRNGFLFSHKLYDATRGMGFTEERIGTNFAEFFSSCVIVDGIGHKRFTWQQVMEATDLITFFSNNVAQNVAGFKYTAAGGGESIESCRSGFVNKMVPEMNASYQDVIKYGLHGDMIARFDSKNEAEARINSDMQSAMSFMTGVNLTAQKLVVQQAIINAMGTGTHKLSAQTGASEQMKYMMDGANLRRLTTYQAMGEVASEKLPLLRIIFEAIIYGIFPLIVLMAIVFPTKVPAEYIKILVWINLWAPTYALLHFIMSYYTQATMTETATLYGGGFSVFANSELSKFNADVVATTGYLATGMAMLTWMLVSKSGAMAAGLAGRVMQGYDQSVDRESNQIVDGKGMRGGVTWEQTAKGIDNSYLTGSGSSIRETANSGIILTQNTSSTLVTQQTAESTASSLRQAVNNEVSNQRAAEVNLAKSNSAVLQDAAGVVDSVGKNLGYNESYSNKVEAMQAKNLQALNASVDNWAKENGVTRTDEFKGQVLASLMGRFESEIGTPKILEILFGADVEAGVVGQVGGSVAGSKAESETEAYKAANLFSKSEQFADVVTRAGGAAQNIAAESGISVQNSGLDRLDSSMSEQVNALESYSTAVSETEAAQESLAAMKDLAYTLKVDGNQALVNSLIATGHAGRWTSGNDVVEGADNLIRRAALGDREALDDVKASLSLTNQNKVDGPSDNFDEVQKELKRRGTDEGERELGRYKKTVNLQGDKWRNEVEAIKPVDESDVDSKHKTEMNRAQGVLSQHDDALREGDVRVKETRKSAEEQIDNILDLKQTPFDSLVDKALGSFLVDKALGETLVDKALGAGQLGEIEGRWESRTRNKQKENDLE